MQTDTIPEHLLKIQEYDLSSPKTMAMSHQVYAKIRQQDPILLMAQMPQNDPVLKWLGVEGPRFWMASRYAEVEQVLLDSETFVCDPNVISPDFAKKFDTADPFLQALAENQILRSVGVTHKRLRSLINKAFTPRVVKALRPKIESLAINRVKDVAAAGRMDLVNDYAFPISIITIAELLGVPLDQQDDFRTWSDAFFIRTSSNIEEVTKLFVELNDYLEQLVELRRRTPGEDLVTELIHAEAEGERLNMDELLGLIMFLIIGGHDTTMTAIVNSTLSLLQNPAHWQVLYNHPETIPHAVEELLRFDPPLVRAVPRWVTKDIQFGGKQVRRGDVVIASLASANRDEAQFQCPHSLNFERQPNQHLTFGKGAHYCVGAPLGRLEVQIALHTLIQSFPDLQLDIDIDQLNWRDTLLLHSLERLPVKWDPNKYYERIEGVG